MAVVGPKEAQADAVALRDRLDGDLGAMPIEHALARLRQEVDQKTIRQIVTSKFAVLEENGGEAHEY
jgi:threonyl-tRNA synthetase